MPARFSDANPSKYYIGDNAASRLYFGDNLIWKAPMSYDFSSGVKPAGIIDGGNTGATTVVSGNLREGTGGSTSRGIALWPETTLTELQEVTVIRGNLAASVDRGVGCAVGFDSAATNGVFSIIDNSTYAIFTKIGTTYTSRASVAGNGVAGDVLTMRVTKSGSTYTYSILLNGTAKTSWTDSGNLIVPGKYWGGAFLHKNVNSVNYYSPGIASWTGRDI